MAEVTNVSARGFWLLLADRELFVPFALFPWFRDATIAQMTHVECSRAGSLRWPDLDVDLAIASIERPEDFPLVSRIAARPGTTRSGRRAVAARAKSSSRHR